MVVAGPVDCGALGISLGSFLVLGVGAIWVLRERGFGGGSSCGAWGGANRGVN